MIGARLWGGTPAAFEAAGLGRSGEGMRWAAIFGCFRFHIDPTEQRLACPFPAGMLLVELEYDGSSGLGALNKRRRKEENEWLSSTCNFIPNNVIIVALWWVEDTAIIAQHRLAVIYGAR